MYNGWLHTVFVYGYDLFRSQRLHHLEQTQQPGSWNDSDTFLEFRAKLLHSVLLPHTAMKVVFRFCFSVFHRQPRARQERFHNAITSVRHTGHGQYTKGIRSRQPPIPDDSELSTSIQ
ncbi:hypothetical protein GQ600_25971 [Phytophthora cactorum]|nr:hypothetical protein GQ600_25971 [Phytophthora cactorum]